jgi:hypothetical protein
LPPLSLADYAPPPLPAGAIIDDYFDYDVAADYYAIFFSMSLRHYLFQRHITPYASHYFAIADTPLAAIVFALSFIFRLRQLPAPWLPLFSR